MTISDKRLRRIAKQLNYFDLHRADGDEFELTTEAIVGDLMHNRRGAMFLDYYTRSGLQEALERYGLWDEIRALDFEPVLGLEHLDDRDVLRVRDAADQALLIELVAHRVPLVPGPELRSALGGEAIPLLAIEWLLMQNPQARFGDRLGLPGQDHPGLGVGREVMTLLEIMAERLEQAGLLAFPEHYHNGLLYDQRFRFVKPEREGQLHALARDLRDLGLAAGSWAIDEGLVWNVATGETLRWQGEEMIRPLSQPLKGYFAGDAYKAVAATVAADTQFAYDPDAVAAMSSELLRKQQSRETAAKGAERA